MLKKNIATHLAKLALLLAALTMTGGAYAQVALNLTKGWNLLGNSSAAPIDVAATFGDSAKITAVWTWNRTTGTWAFYAPSLTASGLATYAQSNGYGVLTSIAPKDGFWVRAPAAGALSGPVAAAVTLVAGDLQQGWNLLGSADNKTPSQLNQSLGSSLTAAGKSMITAWAWDVSSANWKFFSPALEAQGGTALSDYISSKGYLPFTTALTASDGFWLNIAAAARTPVSLGTAGNFVILAKTGVSTTGTTAIVGDIGLSPAAASFITGFGLIADSTNAFSTSSLVTGKIYASNYAVPTPANMTTAISDMQTAFTDAAGRTLPDFTELYAGDISGRTLVPGLYKWSSGVLITNAGVTLSGSATDVWIFQIAQNLTVNNSAIVTLAGGAQAKNVFWQVSGQATLGTAADFKGILLSQTLISLATGAVVNGRLLAQSAVTLQASTVTKPAP